MIGRTLLHYTITEKLGQGGMGVVYKARDKRLNRTVVLKTLRRDRLENADKERRFLREAQSASGLNHPNIVTIYDIATVEDVDFIVMEYVPGRSLANLIPEAGLDVQSAIKYAIQIANALEAAHASGIIHRDLKPGNVMVTENGLVKLLDFGLAKLTEASSRLPAERGIASDTLEGTIVGTVGYMSPEQVLAQPLDGRSDLFSLGALMYEMFTGHRAFPGDSSIAVLTAVLRDDPVPVQSVNPQVPPAVNAVVMRCLQKQPAGRYASAGQLLDALNAVPPASLAGEQPAAPTPARPSANSSHTVVARDLSELLSPKPSSVGPPGPPPPDHSIYLGPGDARGDRPQATLTIVACRDSFQEGHVVPVSSVPFTIGRDGPDLSIDVDNTLSRQHASIHWTDGEYTIRDLGSVNGTYVNGRRLEPGIDELIPFNADVRLSTSTRLRFRWELSDLPDFTGQLLANRYTLTKRVRSSRKTAVYEAADSRPERVVAVKLLSPGLACYESYRKDFEREARTAASLRHPNIAHIYEYGTAPLDYGRGELKVTYYICMEMHDGDSVLERLDAPEHNTAAAVANWVGIVAEALHAAHGAGVVHAGLKPAAVVFTADGTPYVSEFAIGAPSADNGRRLPCVGYPDYMAPEQWEGRPATPKSDQYSLAVLAYRALTGSLPFENQIEPEARESNLQNGAPPADVVAARKNRKIPSALSRVLSRALSLHPDERFGTIREFGSAFRNAVAEVEPAAKNPRIFFSYRRKIGAGWANVFSEKLASNYGFEVFVDRNRLDTAIEVPTKIREAIEEADVFVCLLTDGTLRSAWVLEEIRIASEAGKPMVPIKEEGFRTPKAASLPPHVSRLLDCEEVRLFPEYDNHAIERLAKIVNNILRRRPN